MGTTIFIPIISEWVWHTKRPYGPGYGFQNCENFIFHFGYRIHLENHPFQNLNFHLGQQKQFILPSSTISQGNQIIQIAGQNGQPNQMIIVPQGNIILLPSNNDQNGIKTLQVVPTNQFQTAQPQQHQQQQQIVILSTPDGNSPQGQVIQQIQTDNGQQVSPTQSVGGKKQVKNNSNSMIEHAANVARIYDQSGSGQQVQTNRNNQSAGGQASVVSSQHHYPSPC